MIQENSYDVSELGLLSSWSLSDIWGRYEGDGLGEPVKKENIVIIVRKGVILKHDMQQGKESGYETH